MKHFIIILLSILFSPWLYGLAPATSLKDQVAKSDSVLRIVVVSATHLESENNFGALVKCRIVTKYKGGDRLDDYIYIPCVWEYDPSPDIDIEQDYIVCLETLKTAEIGHPVTYDASHRIVKGKVSYSSAEGVRDIDITEFEKIVMKLISDQKKSQ